MALIVGIAIHYIMPECLGAQKLEIRVALVPNLVSNYGYINEATRIVGETCRHSSSTRPLIYIRRTKSRGYRLTENEN